MKLYVSPSGVEHVEKTDYDALAAELAKMIKARELSAEASATLRDESIAKNDRIRALEAALREVETFMMIVEPRSHKAEYINMLASVRCVLPPYAPQTETGTES